MATSTTATREYRTFLELYSEIGEGVRNDLQRVVDKMGLTLGEDRVRVNATLDAIGASIMTDPNMFHKFVGVLRTTEKLAPLAERLENALQSETVLPASVYLPRDSGPDVASRKRPEPLTTEVAAIESLVPPSPFNKQPGSPVDFTPDVSQLENDVPSRTLSGGSSSSCEEQLANASTDSERVDILQHRVKREKEKRHEVTAKLRSTESELSETKQELAIQIDSLTSALYQCNLEKKLLEEKADPKFYTLYVESEKDKQQLEANMGKQKEAMRELEDKAGVLEEALSLSRRGLEIPNDLHLRLVHYGVMQQGSDEESDSEVDSGVISTSSTVGEVSMCPFRDDLGHHDFRDFLVMNLIQARGTVCLGCRQDAKRIDSHPYGEGVLKSAIAFGLNKPRDEVEKLPVIWRNDLQSHPHKVTAAKCTYRFKREAFCGPCDNATSEWENALVQNYGKQSIKISHFGDVLKPTLLIQMFRAAILSIDLSHYMECQCCGQLLEAVGGTLLNLMKFHEKVCCELRVANDGRSKSACMEEIRVAEYPLKAVFSVQHFNESDPGERMIEYPLAVILDDIGPIIYAQIPPYYWAVPTDPEKADMLNKRFPQIIEQVNKRLYLERRNFFEKDLDAPHTKWRNGLHQNGIAPMLVHRYLSRCCLDECTQVPVQQ